MWAQLLPRVGGVSGGLQTLVESRWARSTVPVKGGSQHAPRQMTTRLTSDGQHIAQLGFHLCGALAVVISVLVAIGSSLKDEADADRLYGAFLAPGSRPQNAKRSTLDEDCRADTPSNRKHLRELRAELNEILCSDDAPQRGSDEEADLLAIAASAQW